MSPQDEIDRFWNFNDSAASEARFREAIRHADDDAVRLELSTQLARSHGLQRKFEEGHATLDHIERELVERANDSRFAVSRVRCLLERGRLFNSSSNRDKALPLFEQAV